MEGDCKKYMRLVQRAWTAADAIVQVQTELRGKGLQFDILTIAPLSMFDSPWVRSGHVAIDGHPDLWELEG